MPMFVRSIEAVAVSVMANIVSVMAEERGLETAKASVCSEQPREEY